MSSSKRIVIPYLFGLFTTKGRPPLDYSGGDTFLRTFSTKAAIDMRRLAYKEITLPFKKGKKPRALKDTATY